MRTKRIHEGDDDIRGYVKQLAEDVLSVANTMDSESSLLSQRANTFYRRAVEEDWITSDVILDAKADVKDALQAVERLQKDLKKLYKELGTTAMDYLGYAMRRDMGDDYLR